jgi:hypothetical protein
MTQIPNITTGLNNFTPELFQRMSDAIAIAEDSNFRDELKGMKVWPSFWGRIFGFKRIDSSPDAFPIKTYSYLWSGGGFSSGVPAEDGTEPENFAPAVNLAEAYYGGDKLETTATYLGVDVQRMTGTGGYKLMPYITSQTRIQDNNGDLVEGVDSYFTGADGPLVRLYLVSVARDIVNPTTGEPYPAEELPPDYGVYAFSATNHFDGRCN